MTKPPKIRFAHFRIAALSSKMSGEGINVGVIEDGRLLISETGTGQGQVISPLLANIYLHYLLDEIVPRCYRTKYEILLS